MEQIQDNLDNDELIIPEIPTSSIAEERTVQVHAQEIYPNIQRSLSWLSSNIPEENFLSLITIYSDSIESTDTSLTTEKPTKNCQNCPSSWKRALSCPNLPEESNSLDYHGLQIRKKEKEHYCKVLFNSLYEFYKSGPLRKEEIFYVFANQLYRFGKHTDLCPLCQKIKKEKQDGSTAHPHSHLFPDALLKTYLKIHSASDHIIYDAFIGKFKKPKGVAYPIFCNDCEHKASPKEHFLKDLYLVIMGGENGKRLRITTEQREDIEWILALLLFRGLLYGVDFLKETHRLYFPKLMDTFFKLRNFCHQETPDSDIRSLIQVFILPNDDYNPNNPNYSLELQLRNPVYTTIVAQNGSNNAFLYTKFDCFHCVVPLDSNNDSFKKYSCFSLTEDKSHYTLPYNREGIDQLFPTALLNHNIQGVAHMVQFLSYLNKPCKIILDEDAKSSMKNCKSGAQEDRSTILDYTGLNKKSRDECIERAKERSPLTDSNQYKKKIEELKQDNHQYKKKIEELKQEKRHQALLFAFIMVYLYIFIYLYQFFSDIIL